MKEWKYLIGSADDFIGAPEWAEIAYKHGRSDHVYYGNGWSKGCKILGYQRTTTRQFDVSDFSRHKIIAQRTESFGNAIDMEFCKANPDHPDCKCKEEGKMSDTNIGTLTYKVKLDISELITERGNKYGAFKDGAEIMRDLKNAMHSTDGWEKLSPSQQEALDIIQHKIGRVLNGDPNYDDNWKDIAGYATLVAEELSGNIK